MRIIKILLLIICLIILPSQSIFAAEESSSETSDSSVIGETFSMAEDWLKTGEEHTDLTMDSNDINDMSSRLYNILLAVGTGIAVVVGAILAIQYMTAGLDKRAQVKEAILPYIISCIVIFGSLGIWKLTVVVLSEVDSSSSGTTTTSSQGT